MQGSRPAAVSGISLARLLILARTLLAEVREWHDITIKIGHLHSYSGIPISPFSIVAYPSRLFWNTNALLLPSTDHRYPIVPNPAILAGA